MSKNALLPLTLSALLALICGLGTHQALAAEPDAVDNREPARQAPPDAAAADLPRRGEGMRERPLGRPAPERQALERKLQEATAELQELRAAGKEEQLTQKRREVQELQQQLQRLQRPPRGADRALRGDQPGRRDLGPRPPVAPPELESRMQHLQVAIENLHAAGMHEPAEHLAMEAQRMRHNLEGRPGGPRPTGPEGREVQRLQSEIQELRRAVGELRARVEELSRDRRDR